MGKKSREREERMQERKKKQYVKYGGFAVAAICIVAAIVFFASSSKPASAADADINEEGNLTIPYSEITAGVLNRFDYGGAENLLVWQHDEGFIRTAYDTCQVCFPRGSVSYSLTNNLITCSACGQSQSVYQLGIEEWGECQPISVPIAYRADTDTQIVIPGAVLSYAEAMFAEWSDGNFDTTLEFYGEQ